MIDSHIPAFICSHIFSNTRVIKLVSHEGGDWQFLCGGGDHGANGHVVGIGHLIDRDPTLLEILQIPFGAVAERCDIGEPWIVALNASDIEGAS